MTFLIINTCLVFMASQALGSSPQLYIADNRRHNIYRMAASGGPHVLIGGNRSFEHPRAVAHDPARNFIYWTDTSSKNLGIGRLSLTSNTTTFIPTSIESYGLAVEPSTGNVIVPDFHGSAIKVLNFNAGTWRTIVSNVDNPWAVVADNQGGWLYWSTIRSKLIERSNMTGGSRTTLVSTDLSQPSSLALDTPGGRLFFCDLVFHIVDSISLDGRNRIRHVSKSSGFYFKGIALDEDHIYLTAGGQRQILRVNKTAVEATTLEGIGYNGSNDMWGLVLTGSSYHQPVVSCGNLQDPNNGEVHIQSHTYGSTVNYTCNIGFYLNFNTTERTCLGIGVWSGQEPSCIPVSCGHPTTPNAEIKLVSGRAYDYGSEVEVNCNEGHHLKGKRRRRCQGDEQWSGAKPVCELVSCENPSAPANAQLKLVNRTTTYGSEIEVTCNDGYYLAGSDRRHCLASRQWSGKQPSCQRTNFTVILPAVLLLLLYNFDRVFK